MIRFTTTNMQVRPPEQATPHSSGFDFFSPASITIEPNKSAWLDSGVVVTIPEGHVGQFHSRMSLASTQGLICVGGIIDPDYNKEVRIGLHNLSDRSIEIRAGDKVAQLIVTPCTVYQQTNISQVKPTKPIKQTTWAEHSGQPELSGEVLCIPKTELKNSFRTVSSVIGFISKTDVIKVDNYQFINESMVSHSRELAEEDDRLLQLIPYILIKKGDSFLNYTRAKGGTEAKLHGKRSLGFGGHIDEGIDYSAKQLSSDTSLAILERAANRELIEEIGDIKLNGLMPYCLLRTLNFDDFKDVGWVHLGVVYIVEVDDDFVPKTTEANVIKDIKWSTPDELKDCVLEEWSHAIFTHLEFLK